MRTSIRLVLVVLAGSILAAASFAVYMFWGLNDEQGPREKLAGIDGFVAAHEVKAAPPVPFLDEDGESLTLERFRGSIVVLNLWATWCTPCVEEMPTLDRLQGLLKPMGVVVVALSLDRGGAKTVRTFFDQNGIKNLGVYVDPTMRAQQGFDVIGLPTTIVIDREGRERGRLVGPASWDDARAVKLVLSAGTAVK